MTCPTCAMVVVREIPWLDSWTARHSRYGIIWHYMALYGIICIFDRSMTAWQLQYCWILNIERHTFMSRFSFRWSLFLWFFGSYRLHFFERLLGLSFRFQMSKTSSDYTLRHHTSECLPPTGNLVQVPGISQDTDELSIISMRCRCSTRAYSSWKYRCSCRNRARYNSDMKNQIDAVITTFDTDLTPSYCCTYLVPGIWYCCTPNFSFSIDQYNGCVNMSTTEGKTTEGKTCSKPCTRTNRYASYRKFRYIQHYPAHWVLTDCTRYSYANHKIYSGVSHHASRRTIDSRPGDGAAKIKRRKVDRIF